MSVIAPGLARGDANGGQKPSGKILVELHGKTSLVVVSKWSADESFEWGCGGRDGQQARRPLDDGGVETDLRCRRLDLGQRQPA
jgi:hypothetical protein